MTFTHALSTNNYGPAKFIVDASAANGTHTTIAAALTSSSSGDTIFIRPGTYTENLTLKAGVNLTAFGSDSSQNGTGRVIISGKATLTAAGSVTISGIQLQTNSDFFLAITGSAASIVMLDNCYLNCTNNTGISFTSSSASSGLSIQYCTGNLGTTGIAYHSLSGAGSMGYNWCGLANSGASTTISNNSSGTVGLTHTNINAPVGSTGTGAIILAHVQVNNDSTNTICLTADGTGNGSTYHSIFSSGTASAVTIGAGVTHTFHNNIVNSTNTNSITGAGIINYFSVDFLSNQVNLINTTTQASPGNSGSFTPTIFGGTTAGTSTYSSQNGYYTRIGNIVICQGTVVTSSTTGTGQVIIGGLPFTIKNLTNYGPNAIALMVGMPPAALNINAGATGVLNTNTLSLAQIPVGSGSVTAYPMSNVANTVYFSITYMV